MSETPGSESHVLLEDSIPQASLESILCTEELQRRPSRPPDYEKENRALVMLGSALANSPTTIFQTLAETILGITQCDSAGLSLLTRDGKTPDVRGKRFYWPAIAGVWNPHVGGGTPRNFGPCGDVLDQNRTLLFRHFERRYPYLLPVIPAAEECLLVPFYVAGNAVGTIWAIMHSDRRKFDAEDNRVMASLGEFASSAYQAGINIEDLKIQVAEREKAEAELRKLTDGLEGQVQARTAELQRNEERLRLAQQAARIGTFEWNIQTGVNTWTPELEEMYGLPPGGFGGTQTAFENLIYPDDRAEVIALNNQALKTGLPTHGEWRVVWPDGSVHWIRGRWQVFMNESGEPSRMIGVNADDTERKLVEESQLRLAAIVESSDDAIYSKTLEGIIVSWNKGAQQIYGYTEAEVVGKPITILIPPELTEEENTILEKLRAGQRLEHYETVRVTKAGKKINVSLTISPIKDSTDATAAISGIARDITERRRAEEALLSSEQRYRLLFEKNVAGVGISSPDGRVLDCNDGWAHILGYQSREEIRGRLTSEFYFNPAERQPLLDELSEKHVLLSRRMQVKRKDGSPVWVLINCAELNAGKDTTLRQATMIDISEWKRAEEVLSGMTRKLIEAQEQERARIARELHDDINQRLAMLAVELEQLQDNPSEFWSRVQELRRQTVELSNGVQALSHDLHSSQLEYLGVVAGMKSWCKEFGERRGMQIDCRHDVRSTLPSEIGLCLFRVLQEALQNAAKHSGVKRIEVQLHEDSGEIHLVVRDSGRGFDVEAVKQRKGLGLTSMRERVRLVNGTIAIESYPGGGTTVYARVPSGWERESMLATG